MDNIREIVIEEIKKVVGDDVIINDDSLLVDDLGINSFRAITILMNLDKKGIVFKNEDIPWLNTFSDLMNALKVK